MTNLFPKNPVGKLVIGTILCGWVAVRAVTYPVRYAIWRAQGNGETKNSDGTVTYRCNQPEPRILLN